MKVGIGYDVHKLVEGRKLILGGIEVPHTKGLLGHSDADVLTHAVIDALLGAMCLGDIGTHFPDTNDDYKDVLSTDLLLVIKQLLKDNKFRIVNVDCVIVAQKPKLAQYIPLMKANLQSVLGFDANDTIINIKATTEENLGFTGREEGISAKAICVIKKSIFKKQGWILGY